MTDNLIQAVVSILLAITGVAIIASLVSSKAKTASVISAGGNAFSQALGTAVGPITGYTPQVGNQFAAPDISYN
jgi:PRD1 phage membrane DNA delivery